MCDASNFRCWSGDTHSDNALCNSVCYRFTLMVIRYENDMPRNSYNYSYYSQILINCALHVIRQIVISQFFWKCSWSLLPPPPLPPPYPPFHALLLNIHRANWHLIAQSGPHGECRWTHFNTRDLYFYKYTTEI